MLRFTKSAFAEMSVPLREERCQELAHVLTERLRGASTFHQSVYSLVSELRALGHDLWSFDESDELEVWVPNYQTPSGPGLVVTFTPSQVTVDWTEQ